MRGVREEGKAGAEMDGAARPQHLALVGVHGHRRADLADGPPPLGLGVALEVGRDLLLGLLRDLRRIAGLRPQPPGQDDVQLDALGQRAQPLDVLAEIAGAAVHDAAHPVLGGRVHLVGHQVEVGGEGRLRALEGRQPGGTRVADGQVLVEEGRAARELIGRDVAEQGADDRPVGERHLAALAPGRRRQQSGRQAGRSEGADSGDPDAGGAEPAQGAAARDGRGPVRAHGHGCSPRNGPTSWA